MTAHTILRCTGVVLTVLLAAGVIFYPGEKVQTERAAVEILAFAG